MSQTPESHSSRSGNPASPMSRSGAIIFLAVIVLVAVVLAVTGIIPRVRAKSKLQDETNALAAPDVLVAKPQMGKPSEEVVLPGNVFAYVDSPIYARTSGYLKRWYFDIGAHVKKGQLLAEIESPEVDQQLAQAKADLLTAQTNAKYAQTTSSRYQDLLKSNAVSQQDTENFTTPEAISDERTQVRRPSQMYSGSKSLSPLKRSMLLSRALLLPAASM